MTADKCLIFNLADIRNIQFECKTCGSRYACRLDNWTALAYYCGNCKEPFLKNSGIQESALMAIKKALPNLLKMESEAKFIIHFEVAMLPSISQTSGPGQ